MNFDTIYNLVEQRAHNHGDEIPEDPRKRSAVNRPPMKFEQPSPEESNEQPNERSWQPKPVDPIEDVLSTPPEEIIPNPLPDPPRGDQKKLEDIYAKDQARRAKDIERVEAARMKQLADRDRELEISDLKDRYIRDLQSRLPSSRPAELRKMIDDRFANPEHRDGMIAAMQKQLNFDFPPDTSPARRRQLEEEDLKDRYIKDLMSKLGNTREMPIRKMIDDRFANPEHRAEMIAGMKKKLGEQGPEGPQGELGSPGELDLDNLPEDPPQRTPEEEARLKEIYAKREARQKQHEEEVARQDRQWELEDYYRDAIGGPPDEWEITRDHLRKAFEKNPEQMENMYRQHVKGYPDPDTPDLNNPSEPDTRNDSKSTKPSPAKL